MPGGRDSAGCGYGAFDERQPGFGGQSFIETTVPKIARLRKMINDAGLNIEIQVDGGINDKNSKLVREAGATVLVAGSYVYGAAIPKRRLPV